MSSIRNHRPIEAWPEWDRYVKSAGDIPVDAQRALIYREKASHRGLAKRNQLLKLKARQVNQEFLNEICELQNLVYLELDVVTAADLAPLKQLASLETLKLEGVRKAEDFTPLAAMEWLSYLSITHAKHLSDLSTLSSSHHLRMLGIEGAMWSKQKIESLRPLCGLRSLEYLFMASVVLIDKDLSCLAEMPSLRVLDCARFSSESQFKELRRLLPKLECQWCDSYDINVG